MDTNSGKRSKGLRVVLAALLLIIFAILAINNYIVQDDQETLIYCDDKLPANTNSSFRILVRNRKNLMPVKQANVIISLNGKRLFEGNTNTRGTLDFNLKIPEFSPGQYDLTVKTYSRVGSDNFTHPVEIYIPCQVILSSDKPVYQPGQTIRMRSLVRNAMNNKPQKDSKTTFTVLDPKGNKVFKKTMRSSQYGIASADFKLSTLLNTGRYKLQVMSGNANSELTVTVKKYVLPKFKITTKLNKQFYKPGEMLKGTISGKYFFGKDVAGGNAVVEAQTYQEKFITIATLSGKTDRNGDYKFSYKLPRHFTGIPEMQGKAMLKLNIKLTDTAGHSEKKSIIITIAKKDIEVIILPEHGNLVAGLPNIVHILTAYPDGSPAKCDISVNGVKHATDKNGYCKVSITPKDDKFKIEVSAADSKNLYGSASLRTSESNSLVPIILRTDKASYCSDEPVELSVITGRNIKTVFVDVLKNSQTVLTKSLELREGSAKALISLPLQLTGALKINAYAITESGDTQGVSKLIFRKNASGLKIHVKNNKAVYTPGETAGINIQLTDNEGNPAPGAVGLSIVDESVFSVNESNAGFLKQIFELNKSLMTPQYQINMFASPYRLLDGANVNQDMAKAYLCTANPEEKSINRLVEEGYISKGSLEETTRLLESIGDDFVPSSPSARKVLDLIKARPEGYNIKFISGPIKQSLENERRKQVEKLALILISLLPLILIIAFIIHSGPHKMKNIEFEDYEIIEKNCNLMNFWGYIFTFTPIVQIFILIVSANTNYSVEIFMILSSIIILGLLIWGIAEVVELNNSGKLLIKNIFISLIGLYIILMICIYTIYIISLVIPSPEALPVLISVVGALVYPWILSSLTYRYNSKLCPERYKKQRRTSLVEYLAVTVTLLILAGMLLPALNSAREKARRISCDSSLKSLGIGLCQAELDGIDMTVNMDNGLKTASRVRSYFPETLYWNPELITDDNGQAHLDIKLADSITTWRTSFNAVNSAGLLGSSEHGIKVFQDFFVDIDLPVSLSIDDEISVPLVCYNYLNAPQKVRLEIDKGDWFKVAAGNDAKMELTLQPSEVRAVSIPIKALTVGRHSLLVRASGQKRADAIERTVEVKPSGTMIAREVSDTLTDSFKFSFDIAPSAIPYSQSMVLKLYPSKFSEVVEGLDAVFRKPYGCFEQTSSTTYPNVLALAYLKKKSLISPAIEMKAQKYINAGYQRLLTFEVKGGGFDWFGRAPANVSLSAYGVLEFTDMAKVHYVDPGIVRRTRNWILSKQKRDGSWKEGHLAHAVKSDSLTAYVTWALAESGEKSNAIHRALEYLKSTVKNEKSTYTRALIANAFLAYNNKSTIGNNIIESLLKEVKVNRKKQKYWTSSGMGANYSRGNSLNVETTALICLALEKTGRASDTLNKALSWISSQKSPKGAWSTTQSTILAMRALLNCSTSARKNHNTDIEIELNGNVVKNIHIDKETSDVMRLIDLSNFLKPGNNELTMKQAQNTETGFTISCEYWVKGKTRKEKSAAPLKIDVSYDRKKLSISDKLKSRVTVSNNGEKSIMMAIVELGIPPGFTVDTDAFEKLKQNKSIAKYEFTGNQIILYLYELNPGTPLSFSYEMKAKYPLKVQAPGAKLYEYYNPENIVESNPAQIEVNKRP